MKTKMLSRRSDESTSAFDARKPRLRAALRTALVAAGSILAATSAQPASLVGTTNAADAFSSATRFFTHCANGYCWVAYHNGSAPVLYSSNDGVSWTSQGNIFSAVAPTSAGEWATRFQGTSVIAFGNNPGGGSKARFYRNGTLNSNGTVTWIANDNQADTRPAQVGVNSLIAAAKPVLWMADPAVPGEEVLGSQLNGPTWTIPGVAPPALASATGGTFSGGAIFPVGGADPNDYIVLRATTRTPYTAGSHRLVAERFDASVPGYVSASDWYNVSMLGINPGPYGLAENATTEVKDGTDFQSHLRFAAVRDTSGNIHAVYVNRNDDVVHYKKTAGMNDGWSSLSTDVTASAAAINRVALGAVAGNNLFLFYSKSDNGIYYKRFDGASWGAEATLKAASAVPLQGALATMELASDCSLGVAWVEGSGAPFSVMYATVGSCATLSTSIAGTKISVDTPDLKMVWDSAPGGAGALKELYVKNEANAGVNRNGDLSRYGLFSTNVWEAYWFYEGQDEQTSALRTGAVTPLEVTPTRVKLRQNYDYTAAVHLQRDWTAYGYPRVAIWETLKFDDTQDRRGATGLNGKGDSPCLGNNFYCAAEVNPTDKVFIISDNTPTYSDLLAIPYSDPFFTRDANAWSPPTDWEAGAPNTWKSHVYEPFASQQPTGPGSFNNAYEFYPAVAVTTTGTEWQPYANDYRAPATLTINGGKGTRWADANENTPTAGDYFNEAEAAYVLDFNPSLGLDVSIDGSALTPRKRPFFKIRQWRSMSAPPSLTLSGVTLVDDVDYKADVKPLARAYFCTPGCTQLANGGLIGDANEWLNDSSTARNYALNFVGANYLYLGADVKFRGLNVALEAGGTGTADLLWEYWNGTAWTSLETVTGFTDQTNSLKQNGTIYWGDDATETDPAGWAPTTVSGSPSLYYVRARLNSGLYITPPKEWRIKTDVLLFQYCSDITAAGQRFAFSVAVTTAVDLMSFDAKGLDGAVELAWQTGSEVDNLGFYVYRSENKSGPFERITPAAIPGLGSSPVGARYSYLDHGVENGRTYYYLLEDYETTGKTERHGPVSATPRAGDTSPAGGSVATTLGSSPVPSRITYGNPDAVSLRILERSERQLLIELTTRGFFAEPLPDGSVRLSIPGFVEENLPGAPAIPTRRAWLEATVGRQVQVASIQALDVAAFSGLHPLAAEAREVLASRTGVLEVGRRHQAEGSAFRSKTLYPEQVARILETAFQGETKKASIELAPLRYDPLSRQLLLAQRLLVRIVFSGREPNERALEGSHGRRYEERGSYRDRSGVLARLGTQARGLYAVRFEDLFGTGRSLDAARLRLSRQGVPVAFHIEPSPSRFGPGSALYFVSEGASLNPYGAEAVYELELGSEPGLAMLTASASPYGAGLGSHLYRLEREENRAFGAQLNQKLWLWTSILASTSKSFSFDISGQAPGADSARLELWLMGVSNSDPVEHRVRLFLNGQLVAEPTWSSSSLARLSVDFSPTLLLEGANTLAVENANSFYSAVLLDRFAVSYPRLSRPEAGVLEGRFTRSGAAEVSGFQATPALLDLSGSAPRWLTGIGCVGGVCRFRVEAGGLYLAAQTPFKPSVKLASKSALKDTSNQYDYLVVGPRAFLEAAEPLLQLRREQGLRSLGVPIEEVFDEFGFGEQSPQALRDFLTYAFQHWSSPSPRYVLLLGDGSYDYKDYLGTGVQNQVPPLLFKSAYIWTASDPLYAAVNGEDSLPDLAIGRLPASTPEEARTMVDKILAFEAAGHDLDGAAVIVSDNPDAAGDFEAEAEAVATSLLAARDPRHISLAKLGTEATRSAILDAFDEGPSLLSYIGHGGQQLWAHENIFNVAAIGSLAPRSQQPFVLTMNCLNGYFHYPYYDSLAEALVKADGKGAIAAFSPSGLSVDDSAQVFHRALLTELTENRHERLGDVVLAAQAAYADSGALPELLDIYHLFGDPAMRIR